MDRPKTHGFVASALYPPIFFHRLNAVREEAKARGYECDEPYDMSDGYLRWQILVRPSGKAVEDETGIDVSLCAPTSEEFDGSEGGMNFSMDLVEYGGEMVGGYCPNNYTPACWVSTDDSKAIRERWNLFDNGFCADAIMDAIEGYFDSQE